MKFFITGLFIFCTMSSVFASEKTIYFGRDEVTKGALKVADNKVIRQGDIVILKAFLAEVAAFVSGPYCMVSIPHLFVRFNNGEFKELDNLPVAMYQARGPSIYWESEVASIELTIPKNADRVEVFALYDRISYNGSSCYLAYDMMECPDSFPINSEYVSNYGKNFKVTVLP